MIVGLKTQPIKGNYNKKVYCRSNMDSSRKQVVLLIDVIDYLILFKYKHLETKWKLSVSVRIFGIFMEELSLFYKKI